MTGLPRVIAVSCGDPSGIGPELAVKARAALGPALPFVWIGDPVHLPEGAAWQAVSEPDAAHDVTARVLPVIPLDFGAPATPGQPHAATAPGVIASIERGVALMQAGAAAALCTLPISKKHLQEGAGFAYPGHTEFLAALAGVERVVMMLASDRLRVVPVTIHIPLAGVAGALTPALLDETLRITATSLAARLGRAPRIAVAGLNPHAGEGGRMGREEIEVIAPVLDRLRGAGLDLRGPLPADTMFHDRARAGYDVAVCMYHDQALIPIKALDFDRGVNVTLGLPFVRTSPDHGTAYDIAGRGMADPSSFVAALRMAARMADGGL